MKILETRYNGIRFRSRTEARWAVFMDCLKVKYEYEKEAFYLGADICYLPDFWIPHLSSFLEIKGEPTNGEASEKAQLLSQQSGHKVYIFWGAPECPDFCSDPENGEVYCDGYDCGHWWCECPMCGFIGIEYNGRAERLRCPCKKSDSREYNSDSKRLVAAYAAAKGFRFY